MALDNVGYGQDHLASLLSELTSASLPAVAKINIDSEEPISIRFQEKQTQQLSLNDFQLLEAR